MRSRRVGSVEDEARLLAEALGLLRPEAATPAPEEAPSLRPVHGVQAQGPHAEVDAAHDDGCTSCLWCRARAWARDHGPETLRSLADVAGLAAEGLRTWAETLEDTAAEQTRDTTDGAGTHADGRSGETHEGQEHA